MKEDLVSIIITLYNKEKYMRTCIESIIGQTYRELEILLVDDCSTDSTNAICQEYAKGDKRVKVIAKDENAGLSAARYTGLGQASGKWTMLVDGDDMVSPEIVEKFVSMTKKDPDIDVVSGARTYSKSPESKIGQCGGEGFVFVDEGNKIADQIYRNQAVDTTLVCKLYRTDFLRKLNLIQYKDRCPQMFFEDYLLTPIVFNEARKAVILEAAYWVHREDENSVSRTSGLSEWSFNHIEAGRIVTDYCRKHHLDNVWERELSKYIAHLMRIYCLMDLQNIPEEKKEKYTSAIWKYYGHYLKQYVRHTEDGMLRKTVLTGFRFSRKLWKAFVLHTYYRDLLWEGKPC